MNKISVLALTLAATFALTSCGPKKLSEAELQAKVDEMAKSQIDSLGKVLDEECNKNFDVMVQAKTDSILDARVAEYQKAEEEKKANKGKK